MLSVRRRQEDAGGRVAAAQTQQLRGGLGMDDDAELEEGEACGCGDDTAFVDPDVALSYIVSRSRRASRPAGSSNVAVRSLPPRTLLWC